MSFQGINFANQRLVPSDDGRLYQNIFNDGALFGCGLFYVGSNLTISAGHLIIGGRQIELTADETVVVNKSSSGFAQIVLVIDLSKTSTRDAFNQVSLSVRYALAQDGFATLTQQDINGSGSYYEAQLALVSLGTGGITGIVEDMPQAAFKGGGLNLKVVGGTSRPGGGDTLTWDGNTEGREIFGSFVKVSDVILTKADFANGVTATLDSGYSATYSSAEMEDFCMEDGMCMVGEMAVSIPYDNYDIGDGFVLSAGIYFNDLRLAEGSDYVTSLTIPGYTGFAGGSVKDNTIWVNTDTDINGCAFSATEPASPVQGMVWIVVGNSSPAAMNIGKKDIVMIYPAACQQYISGAWVKKNAQVYTGGVWHELSAGLRIIADGIYDDSITGGWVAGNKKYTSANGQYDPVALTASYETSGSSLTFKLEGTGYKIYNGSVLSAEDIDFTELKQITFKGTVNGVQGQGVALSVMNRSDNYTQTDAVARVVAVEDAESANVSARAFEATLDVSSINGSYALAVGLRVQNINTLIVEMSEFILE